MERERRTVILVCITCIIYGLHTFLQQGVFVMPFPLNDILFLGVTVYFSFLHLRKFPWSFGLLIAAATFQMLSNLFFWEIFLPVPRMAEFADSLTTDLFGLAFHGLLLAEIVRFYVRTRWKAHPASLILTLLLYIPGLFVMRGGPLFLFIGLMAHVISLGVSFRGKKELKEQYPEAVYHLLILLGFLNFTRLLMFYLYM